jgi:hypothetical protein
VFGEYDDSLDANAEDDKANKKHYKEFVVYKRLEEALIFLRNGGPISAVSFDDGKNICMLLKGAGGSEKMMMLPLFVGPFESSRCGAD